MIVRVSLIIFFVFANLPFAAFAQEKEGTASQYLSFQTGFVISDVNAFGVNLFAEYQRSMNKKQKCIYSISLDYTQSLSDRYWMFADVPKRKANTINLSANIYYIIGKPEGRFHVMLGGGLGATLIAAPDNLYAKPTVNISFTMSFKISGKVYLQLSPLLVVYGNRLYFDPFKENANRGFVSGNFIPVGVRIKL